MKISFLLAALALLAAPYAHALERVASTPYTGSSTSSAELRLPNCTAGQVLTSLGSNTFTCIDTNATLQSNVNGGEIGLPACGANQALAVSGGKFVCANVVQSSPKCADGYSLQGDDGVSLSCVKATAPVSCAAGEVLTSDQGQFKCVTKADTVPACAAGQVLTGQGGKLACVGITATNCNGRITQNWGGYQYCSTISCASGQALTLQDGYPVCAEIAQRGIVGGAECMTQEGGTSYRTRFAWGMAASCNNSYLSCNNSTPILTAMYHDEMPESEFLQHFGYKSKVGVHVNKFICWK